MVKLKEKGIDVQTVTFDDLYPGALDKDGNDLLFMSVFEHDIWATYCGVCHCLVEKYR
ncbi:MAG: hypothetical protein GX799_08105 [Crenarchaeota archaeon]|nr:hypothetical protein [Thermoproteota archaeon]